MPKGFQKGNKLASKQKGTKKAKTIQWENILGWLVGEGGHKYLELLQMQAEAADGVEVNREQKEFMNRFEGLIEYHAPKLARLEQTGPDGKELPQPIIKLLNVPTHNSN